jgi:hypothetical protein
MSEAVACQTHPTIAAIDRCAGCAEPFCSNCLVELYGQRYCGSCKVMALKGQPLPEIGNVPCKEATTALTMSIISLFLLFCPIVGAILAGSALAQAQKASKLFAADPRLTGKERMRAARIIAITAIILAVILFIVDKVVQMNQGGGARPRRRF